MSFGINLSEYVGRTCNIAAFGTPMAASLPHLSVDEDAKQELLSLSSASATTPHNEDAGHSEHFDSWELISRAHPSDQSGTEGAGTVDSVGESVSAHTESAGHDFLADAFHYSITPEDVHSDADTHKTDDLLRCGEVSNSIEVDSTRHNPQGEGDSASFSYGLDTGSYGPSKATSMSLIDDYDKNIGCGFEMHENVTNPAATAAACIVAAAHSAATSAGRFVATLADRLRALAAKFREYVVQHQPVAYEIASDFAMTVQELARSLSLQVAPGVKALSIPLNGASVLVGDIANAMREAAYSATLKAKAISASGPKAFPGTQGIDWIKLGLMLGCAGMIGVLWRLNAVNTRLAGRLAQREGELAELVARVVALQRSISSQRVPIIRHTVATNWPMVIQAI